MQAVGCHSLTAYFRKPRLVVEFLVMPAVNIFARQVLIPMLQPASPELPSYSLVCLQVGSL